MTRTRKFTIAAVAVAALGGTAAIAVPAIAQERGARMGERIFAEADANRDGRITGDEGWAALSARFARADANNDGGVTQEEFRNYMAGEIAAQRGRPASPERLERMTARGGAFFRAMDADRDGKVSLAELRPFAEAMFRARDANGDGALTREEVAPRRGHRDRGRTEPTAAPAPATPAR
ncbi:EF-hand domain-containing protein [Muricoccus radiodurans]|uniref:EF-hand domain-containing protein n=1 Tax=Muricoccus radiodurans TaxID=2231721 RepID=UPI003CFA06EB